ncbi:MAG TPA: hypothetical protein VGH96_08775 [Streptosporangiaceae bacterium]
MWAKHYAAQQQGADREARAAQEQAEYEADLAAHADRLAQSYSGSSRILHLDDGAPGGLTYVVVTVAGMTRMY